MQIKSVVAEVYQAMKKGVVHVPDLNMAYITDPVECILQPQLVVQNEVGAQIINLFDEGRDVEQQPLKGEELMELGSPSRAVTATEVEFVTRLRANTSGGSCHQRGDSVGGVGYSRGSPT